MIQIFDVVVLSEQSPDASMVDQFGGVDLRVAYATGVIPGDLDMPESSYNGIDEPSSIIGMPDDVFAADRATKAYKAASAKSEMSTDKSGDA